MTQAANLGALGTNAGTTGILASTGGGTGTTAGVTGFKNRIINGAMVIDQRNAGASVTATTTAARTYVLDRWNYQTSTASKYSLQQSSTAPAGFVNSLKVTSLATTSLGSSDYYAIGQPIEGYNMADLNWGTANAKTVTLSFWVQSSLTGTFGGSIESSDVGRSYPFTYTISSANTWEQKSITIVGDTSGTYYTTNGAGAYLWFGMGVGSSLSGTAGSWQSINVLSATGATSVVGTNGATFYITGVQLEVGSTATSFDYRPYGTELALCQRYYENNYGVGFAVGSAAAYDGNGGAYITGYQTGSAQKSVSQAYKVTKRAKPTIGFYDGAGNSGKLSALDTGGTPTNNINVGYAYIDQNQIIAGYTGTAAGVQVFWVSSAEL